MKKILIIEDDAALGDILLQKMKTLGYDVELIREGVKGYESLETSAPDIVLLDLFMPKLNGFEILKRKNANPAIAGIPVIVLTNSLEPIHSSEIANLGATDFLVKSNTTPEKISERVREILSGKDNAKAPSLPGTINGKRVLIVEDDDFLGKIMTSRLSSKGAVAVLAKSGEEALVALKEQKFDAALLDILLPGINGFEVLQFIREVPETKDLPVTVISNFNQVKDEEKAKAMGAAFMVKALVNPDEIIAQAEMMLKK